MCRYGNAVIAVALAVYFFLIPFAILVRHLSDPALRQPGVPKFAFRLHRALSPKYERWARRRVASGDAGTLALDDISATEWPLFGSVFYLWATESLQEAWEKDHTLSPVQPKENARGAIEAAAALVADPGHASWVKRHWGDDYLHNENVFYRMLLISGLTSYEKLTGDGKYLPLLRDQVETLSAALDESQHGLLDDYPGECYPGDVLVAIAAIQRADGLLGTDRSTFVERAIRAFEGDLLDSTGLPPYSASSHTGVVTSRARGCSNSYVLIFAPELWRETASQWYASYEKHFWQTRWGCCGFREFPRGDPSSEWYMDVDAGPVVAGYGVSASAFGIAGARANGRFDHAYPLSAEALVMSWPLPDGALLTPRLLSNLTDAPYVGEASLLYCFTRQPVDGVEITTGGRLPAIVYIGLAIYLLVGLLIVADNVRRLWRWRRAPREVLHANAQLAVWAILLVLGVCLGLLVSWAWGLISILIAQVLPRSRRRAKAAPGN